MDFVRLMAIAASACMAPSELAQRMPQWVGQVPYSHFRNVSWGYPTDCSGFVSWALNTTKDGLFGCRVPETLKAYQWGSANISRRIEYDQMRFGDIVTHVFDKMGHKCGHSMGVQDEAIGDDLGYVSGHVFFFDKWVDESHDEFWAYESSQTENQTSDCRQQGPSHCFNHYVKKERHWVLKRAKESCDGGEYGTVTGGPQRIHGDLLCGTSGSSAPVGARPVPEPTTSKDFTLAFTVCGAGDEQMNGVYTQLSDSRYKHNESTLSHKRILNFDYVPPSGLKGLYAWELYTYDLLKPTHTKYVVSVDDLVDPPQSGWQVYGDGIAPAPKVFNGSQVCP